MPGAMKGAPPPPQLVVLRPYPTAVAAVTVATVASAAAAAWAARSVPTPASVAVVAATAATVAALATVLWPKLATDVLGLHGSCFPAAPNDGGSGLVALLLGRVPQLVAASRDMALCHLHARWQARVGWGVNYQLYLLGMRSVVVVHPDDIRAVAVRSGSPRDRKMLRPFGIPVSQDMIFLLEDPRHGRTRGLGQPFLTGMPTTRTVLQVVNAQLGGGGKREGGAAAAATQGATGSAAAADPPPTWLERFDALADTGTPVDLDDCMTEFTLDVMHQLLFSVPQSRAEAGPMRRLLYQLIKDTVALTAVPWPEVFGRRLVRDLRSAGEAFVAQFDAAEATRRAAYADGSAVREPPADLLDVLLSDLDDPAGAYEGDRRRVAADVLFYQIAGHDTTAHSIAWTVHALCDHPAIEARLLAEINEILPPPGVPLTPTHLAALPFTDAVWKEALRLFPPAPLGTVRRLSADLRLPSDGSVLPAGTVVSLPVLPVHLNPEAYPDPMGFWPDRWLPAGVQGCGSGGAVGGGERGIWGVGAGGSGDGAAVAAAIRSPATQRAARASFVPFYLGPRSCPGQNMAAVEATAVLALFLRRYRFERVGTSADVSGENSLTMRPAGFRVTLHRREGGVPK